MTEVLKGTLATLAAAPAGERVESEHLDRDPSDHHPPEPGGAQRGELRHRRRPDIAAGVRRGTKEAPIPRDEYELGVTWLAERSGFSRKKVRSMLDIVPGDWPRLDAAMSALSDFLEDSDKPK